MLVLTRKPGQIIRIWPDPETCQHTTAAELFAEGLIDVCIGPSTTARSASESPRTSDW